MLSIAMATYNGERFLREQLDSLLAQTITDFEVVVCDDCSKDSTVAILEEYAKKDSRFRIYRNEHNLGFKKNFEQAIMRCKGDYIALCDQDDIWYPNHLELLLDNIGNCVLCCGNSDIVDKDNVYLNKRMSDTDGVQFVPRDTNKLLYRELLNANPFQGASMLLKRDFARKCVPIPFCVKYHDAWISTCACAVGGMVYLLNSSVTRYRQHGENVTILNQREKGGMSFVEHIWNDLSKGVLSILHLHHSISDRFAMVERIEEVFRPENDDYKRLFLFMEHAKQKKLTCGDIRLLWDNIEYVTTSHSKRGFFRYWFLWSHMQPK